MGNRKSGCEGRKNGDRNNEHMKNVALMNGEAMVAGNSGYMGQWETEEWGSGKIGIW